MKFDEVCLKVMAHGKKAYRKGDSNTILITTRREPLQVTSYMWYFEQLKYFYPLTLNDLNADDWVIE